MVGLVFVSACDPGSVTTPASGAGGMASTTDPTNGSVTNDTTTTSASGGAPLVSTGGDVVVTSTPGTCYPDVCECSPRIRPIEMDDLSAWSFSPNDVLAFAAGTHQATLTYGPDLGFPSETTTLEMQIEPIGTANDISGARIARNDSYCSSALGVDVKGTFTSGDGAFAEEFTGTITATSLDFARLSIPLSLTELTGSYSPQVEAVAPDTIELSGRLELAVQFGPGVFAGDVLGEYTRCYDGNCMVPVYSSMSAWGYCPFGGFELDTSKDPRVALSDVLDTWNSIPEIEAVWADGSASPLTAELTFDETGLCRDLEGYRVHAQLALSTDDGRLASNLGADVAYFFDEESKDLYITGPTGVSDESVEWFEFGYHDDLISHAYTLRGTLVRFPIPLEPEEISFR